MATKIGTEKRNVSRMLRAFQTLALLGILAAGFGKANAAVIEQNGTYPPMCLNVVNADTADGTPVFNWYCIPDFNEQWNYVAGSFQGIGTVQGRSTCLDVYGGGTAPGTPVILYHCTGQTNQQWWVLPHGSSNEIYGVQSGLCLTSQGFDKQLVIEPCIGGANQVWNIL